MRASLKQGRGRESTMAETKKSTAPAKWVYGWGKGKKGKEAEAVIRGHTSSNATNTPPGSPRAQSPIRRDSDLSWTSLIITQQPGQEDTVELRPSSRSEGSTQIYHTSSSRSSTPEFRPPFLLQDPTSTPVEFALDLKVQEDTDFVPDRSINTTERLADLRAEMEKADVDFYIVPSVDAHGSKYVAASDKRCEFITGLTRTEGVAIVSRDRAYLVAEPCCSLQVDIRTDANWQIIKVGNAPYDTKGYGDWIDFLLSLLSRGQQIGIDARMISYEKGSLINFKLFNLDCKFVFPSENLVDLIWKDKPANPCGVVYVQTLEYTGRDATYKLFRLREWIQAQPPAIPTHSKATAPTPEQMHVGMLVTDLACIAWTLNLRGVDIPFSPLFHAYLYVGLDKAILFFNSSQVDKSVLLYLEGMNIEWKNYTDFWHFLRTREWGEGKLLMPPSTPHIISLMLTHFRYTLAPNQVEYLMSIKNEVELEGLRRAYFRDGVAFVKFFAWLKINLWSEITEWEAARKMTEFRLELKKYMGLACETISASGQNTALPHYSPQKNSARVIDTDTPYLFDSGGQYRDGTCRTTRTIHFGKPTLEMSEVYTRVLQGHIAIDNAVFPEGTSGYQLDVLARKALWKDGLNYMHGTGRGFGSFLTVHEGDHGFSSNVPLKPGHVVTNESGFYGEGKWGVRIQSALLVKRVKTKHEYGGDIWLGFERLTSVPIQTRMVKESMLTKEEKMWLIEHNQRCLDILSGFLKDDKVTLKWLRREVGRGFG